MLEYRYFYFRIGLKFSKSVRIPHAFGKNLTKLGFQISLEFSKRVRNFPNRIRINQFDIEK